MFCTVTHSLKLISLFVFTYFLIACGGGGKADTEPASFSFTAQADLAPGAQVTSNTITVNDISKAVRVSIRLVTSSPYVSTDGFGYSVNGGAYLVGSSDVDEGDRITVRVNAATDLGAQVRVGLTVGDLSERFFDVTTATDVQGAEAQVYFPAANVTTEGTTLSIRGAATDDLNDIASINVVVSTDGGTTESQNLTLTPMGNEDFSVSWSTDITLTPDVVNTVSVYATDIAGNRQETPTVLNITQTSTVANFPAGSDSLGNNTFGVVNMSFSPDGSELWVPVSNASESALLGVNLETGERSEIFAKTELVSAGDSCNGVSYYQPTDTVVMACETDVIRVSRGDGSVTGLPALTYLTSLQGYFDYWYAVLHDSTTILINQNADGGLSDSNYFGVIDLENSEHQLTEVIRSESVDIRGNTLDVVSASRQSDNNQNARVLTISEDTWSSEEPAARAAVGEGIVLAVSGFEIGNQLHVLAVSSTGIISQFDFSQPTDDGLLLAPEIIITSNAIAGLEANPILSPVGMLIDSDKRLSYIVDSTGGDAPFSVIQVDLDSGHRVVLSRSVYDGPV